MSVRYIVFERPVGGLVWTLAWCNELDNVATFSKRENAVLFTQNNSERRAWYGGVPAARPMEFHIGEVVLPDGVTEYVPEVGGA